MEDGAEVTCLKHPKKLNLERRGREGFMYSFSHSGMQ